jgi:hypothetical protein
VIAKNIMVMARNSTSGIASLLKAVSKKLRNSRTKAKDRKAAKKPQSREAMGVRFVRNARRKGSAYRKMQDGMKEENLLLTGEE